MINLRAKHTLAVIQRKKYVSSITATAVMNDEWTN